MKHFIFTILFLSFFWGAFAQNSFVGIQNSPRKGMLHTMMNPAEINHLHRKVEVNLFSVGGSLSNNKLSFMDIIDGGDILDMALERRDGPVNVRTEAQILGPSFGFNVNKWGFGFTSQIIMKADITDLDTDLGRALNQNFVEGSYQASFNSPFNQRINASGRIELGLTAGREILEFRNHLLSAGGTVKLLIPTAYVNMGMNNMRGSLSEYNGEFRLSNATGELNLNYPRGFEESDFIEMATRYNLGSISGIALDLGFTHQLKNNFGVPVLSSGLSLRNIGSLNLGANQINHNYNINIPASESFRIDLLEGSLEEIEEQLLASGYFSRDIRGGDTRVSLPTTLSVYTDFRLSRFFHIGIFGQHRLSNLYDNGHIISQNVWAITPRVVLGGFELYSPWANYEVSGITGGLGLRLGGFFVGSQSLISGLLLSDGMMADVQVGLSLGFGKKLIPQKNLTPNF
ncbi:DUF5723 family protein [Anditalea andensis]|nr:DUF5723 family protein [Anditalea andensis]